MKNLKNTTLFLLLSVNLFNPAIAQDNKADQFMKKINEEATDITFQYEQGTFDNENFYYTNVTIIDSKTKEQIPATIEKLTLSNNEDPTRALLKAENIKSNEQDILNFFQKDYKKINKKDKEKTLRILEKFNQINKGDFYTADFILNVRTINDKALVDINYNLDNIGDFNFKMVTSGYTVELNNDEVDITEPKMQELQTLQFNTFNVRLNTLFNLGEFKEFLPENYKSELLKSHPKEFGLGLINAFENNKKIDVTINLEKPVKVSDIMNTFFMGLSEQKKMEEILPQLFEIKTTVILND